MNNLNVKVHLENDDFIVIFYQPLINKKDDNKNPHAWRIKKNGKAYRIFENRLRALTCLNTR